MSQTTRQPNTHYSSQVDCVLFSVTLCLFVLVKYHRKKLLQHLLQYFQSGPAGEKTFRRERLECRDKIAGSKKGCGKMRGTGANCSNYVKIIVPVLDFGVPTLAGVLTFSGPSAFVRGSRGRYGLNLTREQLRPYTH